MKYPNVDDSNRYATNYDSEQSSDNIPVTDNAESLFDQKLNKSIHCVMSTIGSSGLELDPIVLKRTSHIVINNDEYGTEDYSNVTGVIGLLIGCLTRSKLLDSTEEDVGIDYESVPGIDYDAFIRYAVDVCNLNEDDRDVFFMGRSKSCFMYARLSSSLAFSLVDSGLYTSPTCVSDAVTAIGLIANADKLSNHTNGNDKQLVAKKLVHAISPITGSLHGVAQLSQSEFNALESHYGIGSFNYALDAVLQSSSISPLVRTGLMNNDIGLMDALDSLLEMTNTYPKRIITDETAQSVFNALMTIPEMFRHPYDTSPLFGLMESLDKGSLDALSDNGFFSDWHGLHMNDYGEPEIVDGLDTEYTDYRKLSTKLRTLYVLGFDFQGESNESITGNDALIMGNDSGEMFCMDLEDESALRTFLNLGSSRFVELMTVLDRILAMRDDFLAIDTNWFLDVLRPMLSTLQDTTNGYIYVRWLTSLYIDMTNASDQLMLYSRLNANKIRYILDTLDSLAEAMRFPYAVWRTGWRAQHQDDITDDYVSNALETGHVVLSRKVSAILRQSVQ